MGSVETTSPGMFQLIAQALRRSRESANPAAAKRQRLQDAESDTTSEAPSVAPQIFDPSLDKEDKDFKFEAPDWVGSYLEKHFGRSLSKEERTAMLRKHLKPDTKAMVPPKLDHFITDFARKKVDKARDAALTKLPGGLLYAENPLARPI